MAATRAVLPLPLLLLPALLPALLAAPAAAAGPPPVRPRRPLATKIADYHYYLRDTSYLGKEIACTDEEKDCYRFNRALRENGKCYQIGTYHDCPSGTRWVFDKQLAASGVYKAKCISDQRCESSRDVLMAHDQTCYRYNLISEVCDIRKNLTRDRDIFGDGYCKCTGDNCPKFPTVTPQPEEKGTCRLPDLLSVQWLHSNVSVQARQYRCSKREHECFKQGRIHYAGDDACYEPVTRGPCAPGELLLADKAQVWGSGWLLSVCRPAPCPAGQLPRADTGACLPEEDFQLRLCPPYGMSVNLFGEAECRDGGAPAELLPKHLSQSGHCTDINYG